MTAPGAVSSEQAPPFVLDSDCPELKNSLRREIGVLYNSLREATPLVLRAPRRFKRRITMPKDSKVFLLELEFKTQGKIRGSSTKNKGSRDSSAGIECHGFEFGVVAPYDASSGLPTGKRQHKPISISREVDSASPLLWHALCTNESFQSATLSFFKPSKGGKETVYHTIELTNGMITKIGYARPVRGKRCESLTIQYEELSMDGTKGGIVPHTLIG
jgi:type VI secretion system secreted protein Hcp